MRFYLAFRVFFRVVFSAAVAERVRRALDSPTITEQMPGPAPKVNESPPPKKPARSEALTLLATLQREARFIDLVQEPLADYADAQIGAASRDVLRDCGKVLSRMFAIEPLATESEGTELTVPEGFDANRFRLVGNVEGAPPLRGKLVHHGWQATRCEVPAWTGGEPAALVIAPVEVEVG